MCILESWWCRKTLGKDRVNSVGGKRLVVCKKVIKPSEKSIESRPVWRGNLLMSQAKCRTTPRAYGGVKVLRHWFGDVGYLQESLQGTQGTTVH